MALSLGDWTYHFGYRDGGWLRLERDNSASFGHIYGVLENRNREVSRIAVTPQVLERIRVSFNQRFLAENQEFQILEWLHRDVAFAEAWQKGQPVVDVRGAGYFRFVEDGTSPSVFPLDNLDSFRARVLQRFGVGFLAARIEAARATQLDLGESAAEARPALAPPGRHPEWGYGLARRATETATRLTALQLLQNGAALNPEATVSLASGTFAIDPPMRRLLAGFAGQLEEDLLQLVASSRDDMGFALLVGMARLLALRETLQGGRLVVLDTLPEDTERMELVEIESRHIDLEGLRVELDRQLVNLRRQLLKRPLRREADFVVLENVANQLSEIESGRSSGAGLRLAGGSLLPERRARQKIEFIDAPPRDVLKRHLAELREREEAQRARLASDYRYNLLTRNCASELFAQLESAVVVRRGGKAAGRRGHVRTTVRDDRRGNAESAEAAALGGHVQPGRGLQFIPFLAAEAARANYRIARRVVLPSHRRRLVAEIRQREGVWALLREANVLTSTVYHPNLEDSAFLFFTDDALPLRPLLGSINLLYGIGATVVGLPLAGFDQGRLLSAGLRGALWSLPELAFVNVRKGSFFFVPRDASPDDSPGG